MTDNITETERWWTDRSFPTAQILATAGETAAVLAGPDRAHPAVTGELNGLVRALCLTVDPLLYDGTGYGLLRGSSVWAHLWSGVLAVVRLPSGEREAAMFRLYREWPQTRSTLIAHR